MKKDKRVAVFIDCENISSKFIPEIFSKLNNTSNIILAKAYGNWKNLNKDWDEVIIKYGIKEEHVFSPIKGKNSVDIKMVVDIMSISNYSDFEVVVLVSSDSDFRSLILELNSKGIESIGFGENKTHEALRSTYSSFFELPIYINKKNNKLFLILKDALKNTKKTNGYTLISQVGSYLKEKDSNNTAKRFGVKSWTEAFKKYKEYFEVNYIDNNKSIMYVKELK